MYTEASTSVRHFKSMYMIILQNVVVYVTLKSRNCTLSDFIYAQPFQILVIVTVY
jgi:hypothetical protein